MIINDSNFSSILDRVFYITKLHQNDFSRKEWNKITAYYKWLRMLAFKLEKSKNKNQNYGRFYDPKVSTRIDQKRVNNRTMYYKYNTWI